MLGTFESMRVVINGVSFNNRKRAFAMEFQHGTPRVMPYAGAGIERGEHVCRVVIERRGSHDSIRYTLRARRRRQLGRQGMVTVDDVFAYYDEHLSDRVRRKLVRAVKARVEASPLSRRELIRRLQTSP